MLAHLRSNNINHKKTSSHISRRLESTMYAQILLLLLCFLAGAGMTLLVLRPKKTTTPSSLGRLERLPREIREQIYAYCGSNAKYTLLTINDYHAHFTTKASPLLNNPLAAVSKHIRQESNVICRELALYEITYRTKPLPFFVNDLQSFYHDRTTHDTRKIVLTILFEKLNGELSEYLKSSQMEQLMSILAAFPNSTHVDLVLIPRGFHLSSPDAWESIKRISDYLLYYRPNLTFSVKVVFGRWMTVSTIIQPISQAHGPAVRTKVLCSGERPAGVPPYWPDRYLEL
jgi:hypothetical protein